MCALYGVICLAWQLTWLFALYLSIYAICSRSLLVRCHALHLAVKPCLFAVGSSNWQRACLSQLKQTNTELCPPAPTLPKGTAVTGCFCATAVECMILMIAVGLKHAC